LAPLADKVSNKGCREQDRSKQISAVRIIVRRDVEARRYDPSRAGTVILGQTRRKLHSFEPPVAVEGFDLHAYWPERPNNDAMHNAMHKWLRQLILESVSAAD
jgi:hypothetical protein